MTFFYFITFFSFFFKNNDFLIFSKSSYYFDNYLYIITIMTAVLSFMHCNLVKNNLFFFFFFLVINLKDFVDFFNNVTFCSAFSTLYFKHCVHISIFIQVKAILLHGMEANFTTFQKLIFVFVNI